MCTWWLLREEEEEHCCERHKALLTLTQQGKGGHQGSPSCFYHSAASLLRPWDLRADVQCLGLARVQAGELLCAPCVGMGVCGVTHPCQCQRSQGCRDPSFVGDREKSQSLVYPPAFTFPADWRKYGLRLGSEASEATALWSGLTGGELRLSFSLSQLQWPASPSTMIPPMTSAFCQIPAESLGNFKQINFWVSSLTYRIWGVGLCSFKKHPHLTLCKTKLENHNKQIGVIKAHCPGKEAGRYEILQTRTSLADPRHCCFPLSCNWGGEGWVIALPLPWCHQPSKAKHTGFLVIAG